MNAELPPGYLMEWGGEHEDSRDSQASLIPGIVPAVVIMAMIIVSLFNAFRPPLVIVLTIPFAMIGITIGLLGTGAAFGFVALLGAMSLAGMMIKNAMRKNRLTRAGPNRRLPTCLIGLIALASFVTGCTTLGPDYKKPEAQVSAQWIDIDAPRVNSQPADLADWWTVFDDPVLNSLVEMAYTQNLTLRIAGLRILEARASLGIAIGSKYPQVQQANGSATRNKLSKNDPGSKLADRRFDSAEATFDLAWELDFWGRFRRAIESAEAQLDASIADYDDVMVALAAEVARSYILIRTFEERIALAEQNVVIQERALRIADVKFRNGAVTELDMQQAKAVLNNTEALIPWPFKSTARSPPQRWLPTSRVAARTTDISDS